MSDTTNEGLTLYFHSSAITPQPGDTFHDDVISYSLRKTIDNIADLYLRGFFPLGSIIWVNGDMPEAGIWALTDKSSHVRIYTTPRAGWCRVTRSSVRFAPTAAETTKDPAKTLTLPDLDPLINTTSSIVVSYVSKERPLQFIVESKIRKAKNGVIHYDPFTIIDMPNHTSASRVTNNRLEVSDAHQNGFKLMTMGCSEERTRFVHENYDTFRITLKDSWLKGMSGEASKTQKAMNLLLCKISDGMHRKIVEDGAILQPDDIEEDDSY